MRPRPENIENLIYIPPNSFPNFGSIVEHAAYQHHSYIEVRNDRQKIEPEGVSHAVTHPSVAPRRKRKATKRAKIISLEPTN